MWLQFQVRALDFPGVKAGASHVTPTVKGRVPVTLLLL